MSEVDDGLFCLSFPLSLLFLLEWGLELELEPEPLLLDPEQDDAALGVFLVESDVVCLDEPDESFAFLSRLISFYHSQYHWSRVWTWS